MKVLRPRTATMTPIERYDSVLAESTRLAGGHGDAHVHVIQFQPRGVIGAHEAGFGQVLVFIEGDGWVAGEDGHRRALAAGELAFIRRGETHSKGSERGATALMIQIRDLQLDEDRGRPEGQPRGDGGHA